jgi:hypothetical protein
VAIDVAADGEVLQTVTSLWDYDITRIQSPDLPGRRTDASLMLR